MDYSKLTKETFERIQKDEVGVDELKELEAAILHACEEIASDTLVFFERHGITDDGFRSSIAMAALCEILSHSEKTINLDPSIVGSTVELIMSRTIIRKAALFAKGQKFNA